MRVNIIVAPGDTMWIGGRLASELALRLPNHGIEATINGKVGDLEFHQIVYGPPENRPAVGMFTHGEHRPRTFGGAYDGQVSLNPEMHHYLVETVGIHIPTIIELPVDDQFHKKSYTFGVSGRVYGDGRKGEHLVKKMVEAGYNVIAWGQGWPCPIVETRLDRLRDFYARLDYYVDTSSDEGGCTPALECAAMGIPVISHTLGITKPVLGYKTHDWQSLAEVLYKLTHHQTYDKWAKEYADYFKAVLNRVGGTV